MDSPMPNDHPMMALTPTPITVVTIPAMVSVAKKPTRRSMVLRINTTNAMTKHIMRPWNVFCTNASWVFIHVQV